MSTDPTVDLVSGVLTRISEIEKEALSISARRFVEGMAGRRVDPDLNRYLDTICDPDEVLRLCRAHRQIVERHGREQRMGYQPDDDDTPGTYGKVEMACTECGAADAAVRWPCPTLRDLAVGLGVVEEDRNGE